MHTSRQATTRYFHFVSRFFDTTAFLQIRDAPEVHIAGGHRIQEHLLARTEFGQGGRQACHGLAPLELLEAVDDCGVRPLVWLQCWVRSNLNSGKTTIKRGICCPYGCTDLASFVDSSGAEGHQ